MLLEYIVVALVPLRKVVVCGTAVVNCWHVTFLLVSCYELVIHSFGVLVV